MIGKLRISRIGKNIIHTKILIGLLLFLTVCHPIDSKNKVYIDPENVSDTKPNGSKNNPYSSWDDVKPTSNTTYHIKRSTTLTLHKPISLHNKTNITVKAYGKGASPIIHTGQLNKPLNILSSRQIFIKDLYINGDEKSSHCIRINGKCRDIKIENCTLINAIWGIRLIGFKGKNKPIHITLNNISIKNMGDDGIFAQRISKLTIDSCKIQKVNQKWFTVGKKESESPGDGIQLDRCSNFTISHCNIDRTDTGNKFCLIANSSSNGEILNNTLKGPIKNGSGACMYIGYQSDSILIKSNIISDSPCGIYSHSRNLVVFKNILKNNKYGVIFLSKFHGTIINNTFWNNRIALKGSKMHILNNIFYTNNAKDRLVDLKPPFRINHNCFFVKEGDNPFKKHKAMKDLTEILHQGEHNIFSDPMIDEDPFGELRLMKSSPCIDQGTSYSVEGKQNIPYCGNAADIGAREFCPHQE